MSRSQQKPFKFHSFLTPHLVLQALWQQFVEVLFLFQRRSFIKMTYWTWTPLKPLRWTRKQEAGILLILQKRVTVGVCAFTFTGKSYYSMEKMKRSFISGTRLLCNNSRRRRTRLKLMFCLHSSVITWQNRTAPYCSFLTYNAICWSLNINSDLDYALTDMRLQGEANSSISSHFNIYSL